MPNIKTGVSEILYTLFGVVEHSGRLQGGHYTAYIKLRPASLASNVNEFYSPPTARNEEIHTLLAEIERKSREIIAQQDIKHCDERDIESQSQSQSQSGKWYYISDTSVTEVTEEKVLKCQAYLLFYERVK